MDADHFMDLKQKAEAINAIITENVWFDMTILDFNGFWNLEIIGSIDLTYYYTLKIVFKEICHISINVDWHTEPSRPVFELLEGAEDQRIRKQRCVLDEYAIFKITHEEAPPSEPFYVAAKDIAYSTEKVRSDVPLPC